nr:PrpF domain-containing protein [Actinoplanes sp. OR16]
MAGVPVVVMRGGSGTGFYFLREDLPADAGLRDELLLRVLGSPVDGIGEERSRASTVVVIGSSSAGDADVDCRVLRVCGDEARVAGGQACEGTLAGAGAFAIERGLVAASRGRDAVRVRVAGGGGLTAAVVHVPVDDGGRPVYHGETAVCGVPGTAARIIVEFRETKGAKLLPTGNVVDDLGGIEATLIDNGTPVVLVEATALGVTGHESPTRLEYDDRLRSRVESLRLLAGELMGLGDVRGFGVPEMGLISPPADGGSLCARMFSPHRVHPGIGVMAGVSVGTAAAIPGSVAARVRGRRKRDVVRLEHPGGWVDVVAEVGYDGRTVTTGRTAVVSTARMLLDGTVHPR